MSKTTTIEFYFEYEVLVGQLNQHNDIPRRKYFSINKFYDELADEQDDLLTYKDAENIAENFRDDSYWAIRDTVRKHFARNDGVTAEGTSITDFEVDDYVYVDTDFETTIGANMCVQIVLYIEDESAFDRNKLFGLVRDRFLKESRESKYAKNLSLHYEISISDFMER